MSAYPSSHAVWLIIFLAPGITDGFPSTASSRLRQASGGRNQRGRQTVDLHLLGHTIQTRVRIVGGPPPLYSLPVVRGSTIRGSCPKRGNPLLYFQTPRRGAVPEVQRPDCRISRESKMSRGACYLRFALPLRGAMSIDHDVGNGLQSLGPGLFELW